MRIFVVETKKTWHHDLFRWDRIKTIDVFGIEPKWLYGLTYMEPKHSIAEIELVTMDIFLHVIVVIMSFGTLKCVNFSLNKALIRTLK